MTDLSMLLTAASPIFAALIAWATARQANKSQQQAAKGDRMDALEKRIDELQGQLDEERAERFRIEEHAHDLRMALRSTLSQIKQFFDWIDAGQKPPPPTRPDLTSIQALLD